MGLELKGKQVITDCLRCGHEYTKGTGLRIVQRNGARPDSIVEICHANDKCTKGIKTCSVCNSLGQKQNFVSLKVTGPLCHNCFSIDYFRCQGDCKKVYKSTTHCTRLKTPVEVSDKPGFLGWCIDCANKPQMFTCIRCRERKSTDCRSKEDKNYCDYCYKRQFLGSSQCDYIKEFELPTLEGIIKADEVHRVALGIPGRLNDVAIKSVVGELVKAGELSSQLPVTDIRALTASIDWSEREGETSLTKRIAAWLFKNKKLELQKSTRDRIGDLINKAVINIPHADILFTRNVNRLASYFCNSSSCWWGMGGYGVGRCFLKSYGGWAMLLMSEGKDSKPIARVFIQPLNDAFRPVNKIESTNVVMYNCYGAKTIEQMAAIYNQLTGLEHVATRFSAYGGMSLNAGPLLFTPDLNNSPRTGINFDFNKDCKCER